MFKNINEKNSNPQGAKSGAVTYSVIETVKENYLNLFEYLKHLFEQLPNVDINDSEVLDSLLHWSPILPESCKSKLEAIIIYT